MLHAAATGKAFKMPDSDDEIYGRSFFGGLSHADSSETKEKKVREIEEEEVEQDRLDIFRGGQAARTPPPLFKDVKEM